LDPGTLARNGAEGAPSVDGPEAAIAAERPAMSNTDNITARICLNVAEAAVALGCSTKTIRRMLADKRLPYSRLKTSRGKGRVVIKVADLENLLEPEPRQ
jgi:excisionase family DNA binding protein